MELRPWPIWEGGSQGPGPHGRIDVALSTYQAVALAKWKMQTLSPVRLLGEALPKRCPTGPAR